MTDRWTTTIIVIIQMFEILEVLEETMIDIDKSAQFGIFVQIFQRIFFVILIAYVLIVVFSHDCQPEDLRFFSRFRHYPTLASLQFQNSLVRLLTVIYFFSSTIYLTFCESCDMHWVLIVIKIFSSTKGDLQIVRPISLPIIKKELCHFF